MPIFNPPGESGGPVLSGNSVFVDAVNGNDSTAVIGNFTKPFLTLGAAKAAATSGMLIYVRPGSYTVMDTILKNGVNWWFAPGASVSKSVTGVSVIGILDDSGSPVSCNVFGEGDFLLSVTNQNNGDFIGCVHTTNSGSNVTIHARTLGCAQDNTGASVPCGISQANGTLRVACSHSIYGNDANVSNTSGCGVYWEGGNSFINAPLIYGTNFGVISQDTNGTVVENMYVTAQQIYTTGASQVNNVLGVVVAYNQSNANSASWITADVIQGNAGSGFCSVFADSLSAGRMYVSAKKLFGFTSVAAGLIYVDADKCESLANVGTGIPALFMECSGGALRYNVRHHDPKAFTGKAFLVDGGTFISNEIEYTSGSGSDGLSISSGTARLQTAILNTAANSSGNPITISGGTLILMANTLVSQGSRNSVTAGTAQNVVAMSSWANNLANVNVTVTTTGGLTVNAAVV